jgi:hypothetical protein
MSQWDNKVAINTNSETFYVLLVSLASLKNFDRYVQVTDEYDRQIS